MGKSREIYHKQTQQSANHVHLSCDVRSNYADRRHHTVAQYMYSLYYLWPLLLTWFNFNPSTDK